MAVSAQTMVQDYTNAGDSAPGSRSPLSKLHAAAAIQRSWLPGDDIVTAGRVSVACSSTPVTLCGGDLCAVYPVGEALFVVMGDATGHGLDATLLASVVKGACDVAIRSIRPLSAPRLLELLNVAVVASAGGMISMSCSVAMVASRTMTVASAGHPLPYVLRVGAEPAAVQAYGNVLGTSESPEYVATTVSLRPGDRVLWYTDGVTDCENPAGAQFGHRRLRKLLRRVRRAGPRTLVRDMEAELAGFRGDAPLVDDTTFAVAEVC